MANTQPGDDRRFGYWVGHFAVVGTMIGSGILTTSGYTLQATGNPAGLLGLWVLGGILAICGAITVAEMATSLPRTGGDYIFVREAFGHSAGFVSGWGSFIIGFAAPTAVIAHLSMTYLLAPFSQGLSILVPVGATLMVLLIAVIHTLGHHESSRLQTSATILTAAVLISLACGGILFGRGDWNHFSASTWPTNEQIPPLTLGLVYVGFAYGGWNAAGYLAGEIRDPSRTLPRSLIGGASTVMALYLLVNLSYIYALDPVAMMNKSPDDVQAVAKLAAEELFGPTAASVISVALGMGLMATVSAALLTGPRVVFAMARDGVFPRYAGQLHAVRRTPIAATITQAILATFLIWAGTFRELLDYASIGFWALSGLTVASIFPLRGRADLPRPYRIPLYPLPPLAYLVLVIWSIGELLLKVQLPAVLSLATILLGIPISWLIRKPPESPRE